MTSSPEPRRGQVFRSVGFELDPPARRLTCRYAVDGRDFAEQVTFPADDPSADGRAEPGRGARIDADPLLRPMGAHFVPKRYAADDLLV